MRSILSKLWFSITSLVLVIIMIIWIFQVVLLNKFYVRERANNLLEYGNQIVSIITTSNDYKIEDEETINKVNSTAGSFNAQITIIDNDKNILFYSIPRANPNKKNKHRKDINYMELEDELKKEETFVIKKARFDDSFHFIIVGIPIKKNRSIVGYVLLTSPLEPIKETISILKNQLTIITLVSLLIATFLSLLLAKLFTNPILKITRTSKRIASGDFTASVKLKSKDEIRDLGDTVNNMAVQLGQTEKFRREFIANTSHELKTPISLIRAYAELIMYIDDEDKQSRDENLKVIIDESKRLDTIVKDILYLSQMEAGYYKLELKSFLIIDTINNVLKKLFVLLAEKNINIKIKCNENIAINADEDKMFQVLFNLINNAINYSYENGNIIIKVEDLSDKVRIEIIDNGRGISKKDIPYIWDRFYKADKSRKRNNTSTGLGMAIVKNILELHNFYYGIESELDKGTTVWIEIMEN